MTKIFDKCFSPLNTLNEHLENANRITEIFNTQNHFANIISSVCPNGCNSVVNLLALL